MLNLKEERRYTRLRKLAQELHIPMPEAFIMLEVFDKNGKLIQKHQQRSHSWVRNAYNLMFAVLAGKDQDDVTFEAGKLSQKSTAGNIESGDGPVIYGRTDSIDNTTYGYRAAGSEDTWGILVGKGTNAENFEDHFLQTQLTEGTGADQISHALSEAHAISYAALVLKNDLIRYFNNNTGDNRDVNEVTLVTSGFQPGSSNPRKFMMARDKLASTVTVPDTGQLKVTYTVQLTYPA